MGQLYLFFRNRCLLVLCCISLAAADVWALPPRFYISGESRVCLGNELTYTIGGLVKCPAYSWEVQGGQITATGHNYIVVRWNSAGEGEVSVRTSGCGVLYAASKTVVIGGGPPPDMPLVTPYCGSTVLTRGSPTSEVTWYWQTSPQGRSRQNASETYTCTADATLYLRAYHGNSGCWSEPTAIAVTVSHAPDFTLSGNTTICDGSPSQLSASGSPGIAYSWSPAEGLSDPHIANPLASPSQTTTYTLTGSLNGCATTKEVTVTVAPPFVAAISSQAEAGLSRRLTASNQTDQPASYTWSWPGSGSPFNGPVISVQPGSATTYTLTATHTGSDCVSTASITIDGQNQNYIISNTLLADGIKTEADLAGLTKEQRSQSITYFDGLGRPMQTVLTQGSPSGKDVVQPVGYDAFGRQDKKYLPYVDQTATNGFYKPHAIKTPDDAYQGSDQFAYYQQERAIPGKYAADETPYAQTIFEASPLNRVLEQGSPGAAFQPGTGRTVKFTERSNALEEVRLWDCSGSTCASPGFYNPDELYGTQTLDEHDNLALEFKDKQGKLVLKQVQGEEGLLSTYYCYDELDNLRLVIQPEGAKRIPAGAFTPDAAFMAAWCFRYSYDGRRRLIEKQVPGSGVVFMVYDKRDRLVLSQDAVQRTSNEWSYTRYDALNRAVETGIYKSGENLSQKQMQERVDAFIASQPDKQNNVAFGSLSPETSPTSFPDNTDQAEPLTITHYDNYDFVNSWPNSTAYAYQDALNEGANFDRVRGQVTGLQVKVLGSSTWLKTVNYYDDKYRIIQTVSDNHVGGTDQLSSKYDFAGKVLETLLTQTKDDGAAQYLVHNQFTYDHGGRLLETRQRMGTNPTAILHQPQVIIASNQYNELGQLVDKGLHRTDDGQTPLPREFLQSVDYRYNIRGWLTHLNNADLSIDNEHNDEANDAFGLELTYHHPKLAAPGSAGSNAQAYFNGNISQAIWKTQTPGGTSFQRAYAYSYDPLSRLTAAQYGTQNTAAGEDFSLYGMQYDGNGNITRLNRKGLRAETEGVKSYGILDQLSYHYQPETGNQLQGVDDLESTASMHDFEDKNGHQYSSGAEYGYDANGNLIRDINKGILAISYNHLNLPRLIDFGNGNQLAFTYTATGLKLQKQVYTGNMLTTITDYAGSFVYETPAGQAQQLVFAHMAEGRVLYRPEAVNPWQYEYHLKDHLGNLRMSVREGEVHTMRLSMEPANASTEEQTFERVSTTRRKDYYHSRSGEHAARLNARQGDLLGPGKRLQVKKGDKLEVEVFGHYQQPNKPGLLYSLAAFLAGNAAVQIAEVPKEGQNKDSSPFPLLSAGLAFSPQVVQQVKGAPQAYLSFIAYDSTGSYISSDYQLLTSEARDSWQQLKLEYTASQDGYVEVFTANESGQDAYFDDLLLTTHTAMQVQENHYDPWGLNLVGIESQGFPDHKFQYNGKEKQEEFGLHWNDYGARFYDPQLGRWHSVDPMTESQEHWTPYNYVFNNSVRLIDPDGRFPDDPLGFATGFASAIRTNMGVGPRQSGSANFEAGQKAGDVASILIGAVETAGGLIVGSGGVVVTIGTAGLAAEVSVPAVLVGAGAAAHGWSTMMNGDKNFKATDQNGRVNASRNNRPSRDQNHIDKEHVNRQNDSHKSKYLKPNQAPKLEQRTMRNPDRVINQRDGRIRFEKDYGRKIGTRGETSHRVVHDPKKDKTRTSFHSILLNKIYKIIWPLIFIY